MSLETYQCGCRVRVYEVDTAEWEGDAPEKPVMVREFEPCPRHGGSGLTAPPSGIRLISVLGQNESYLSE